MKNFGTIYDDSCSSVYSNEYMDSTGFAWQESEAKARKYKIHKSAQLGRSMVEMLGVLAVIGVLSVAGVAGFKTAMDKHRSNELMNEASKRAVIVMAQLAQGRAGDISLSEFTNNDVSGARFATSATTVQNTNKFAIGVSGVEKSICQNLVNMAGGKVQISKSDNVATPITAAQCADSNTLAFLFESDENFGSGNPNNLSSNSSSSECGYYECEVEGYGSGIIKDGNYVGTCGTGRTCYGGGTYCSLDSAIENLCSGSMSNSQAGYYSCEDSGNSPYILKDGNRNASCESGYICRDGADYYDSLDSALNNLCQRNQNSTSSQAGYYSCEDSGNSPYILKDGYRNASCESGYICRGGADYYDSLDSALNNLCQRNQNSTSSSQTYVYECRYGDTVYNADNSDFVAVCESQGYSYCSGNGEFYSDDSAIENLCH